MPTDNQINVQVSTALAFKVGQRARFFGVTPGDSLGARRMVAGTITRLWWTGENLYGAIKVKASRGQDDTTHVLHLSGHPMISALAGGRDHFPVLT